MARLTVALLSIATLGTGLLAWAFTQSPVLGLVSGGVAGGRLAISIVV